MPQEMMHQDAIKLVMENSKKLLCFYQHAAEISNDSGKKVFTRLANEKIDNLSSLFNLYFGSDLGTLGDFLARPCREEGRVLRELSAIKDTQIKEKRAREMALDKELQSERLLLSWARNTIDPGVKAFFERMAAESRKRYDIIESEYALRMRMPHETDINTFVRE